MKTQYIILIMLFIHWIADFIFQTHEQATNKSKSNWYLFKHVLSYSLTWFVLGIVLRYPIEQTLLFTLITFIIHFATDWITSRINSSLYAKNQIHNFFVSVGFDQWLHYAQLIFTYQFIVGF